MIARLCAPALAASLLLAACDSPGGSTDQLPVPTTTQEWVAQNAHPLRSISVDDRDFRDLRPLREAIGDARVVMLGEPTHGDGAAFLAKARLIAFLHREMGFDVLAWESGMYDVHRIWEQIRAGEDVVTASRRGIFGVWSLSAQVRPTLDYVQSTVGTSRPLEMAGIDLQFTTLIESDSLTIHVARFAREIGSTVVNDPGWGRAMTTLRELSTGFQFVVKPGLADQENLMRLLQRLRTDAVAAGTRGRFWTGALASIMAMARLEWSQPPSEYNVDGYNQRDAQMARNLVWLADEYYRGRKIIVWAASSHIARGLETLRLPNGQPQNLGGWTVHMGAEAYRELGDDMYAIGITAARGTWGRESSGFNPLMPPIPGSLEGYLDAMGTPYAFVDLRTPTPGRELARDLFMRPFGYGWLRGDWSQVLDGMIYIREMTPSTRATGG